MKHPEEPSARRPAEDLRRQIEELRKSWPAHSVPAAMLQRLEELEEELEQALQKSKAGPDA